MNYNNGFDRGKLIPVSIGSLLERFQAQGVELHYIVSLWSNRSKIENLYG